MLVEIWLAIALINVRVSDALEKMDLGIPGEILAPPQCGPMASEGAAETPGSLNSARGPGCHPGSSPASQLRLSAE